MIVHVLCDCNGVVTTVTLHEGTDSMAINHCCIVLSKKCVPQTVKITSCIHDSFM